MWIEAAGAVFPRRKGRTAPDGLPTVPVADDVHPMVVMPCPMGTNPVAMTVTVRMTVTVTVRMMDAHNDVNRARFAWRKATPADGG